MKTLDCTIRDGGYLNKWQFSDLQVMKCFEAASKSGFDYVELGFRSSKSLFSKKEYGKWLFCSENDLKMVYNSVDNPSKISVMVRPENIELDSFLNSDKSVIDMIRVVITDPSYVTMACEYVEKFKSLGYTVGLNPIRIDIYSKKQLKEYFSSIVKLEPSVDYFFIADTYGSIDFDKISELIDVYNEEFLSKQKYITKLGFHAHNNLQDATLKAMTAIKMKFDIIDSCMFGLGRGPGNLCSELLIGELQKIDGKKYNVLPALKYINEHIHNYKNNTNNILDCRYNLVYVMTGLLTVHPDYGEYIIKLQDSLSIDIIWDLFNNLVKSKKNIAFDKIYFDQKIKDLR